MYNGNMNNENSTPLSEDERTMKLGHKGAIVWFTGLSASGKSTITGALERFLVDGGIVTCVVDGDAARQGLNSDLGFSRDDRRENVRRIAEVARLLSESGVVTIVACISPYEDDRRLARSKAPEGRFIEVYCDCPIESCMARDPKGLYKKVKDNKIGQFTGVSDPYEPPKNPEIVLKTAETTVTKCVKQVLETLIPVIRPERWRK